MVQDNEIDTKKEDSISDQYLAETSEPMGSRCGGGGGWTWSKPPPRISVRNLAGHIPCIRNIFRRLGWEHKGPNRPQILDITLDIRHKTLGIRQKTHAKKKLCIEVYCTVSVIHGNQWYHSLRHICKRLIPMQMLIDLMLVRLTQSYSHLQRLLQDRYKQLLLM